MTGRRGVGPPRRHVDRAGRPGAGGRVLQEGHRRRARQHALSPVALLTPGAGEEGAKLRNGSNVKEYRDRLKGGP